MDTPSMSEAASNSKLVDYDPDESSLEPGEVITPPRVGVIRKETDVCNDALSRQEERTRVHKSDKKEGNARNSTHRSFNQDSKPFHRSSRKRQFNARRGRGCIIRLRNERKKR